MRIYNKKMFASGVFLMALGLLNLITGILRKDMGVIILIISLFALGLSAILRSVSRRMSLEDRLEELDERNRLIALKSQSKSFQLTQLASFALMLILLVMGKASGRQEFIAMGTGLAFTFFISLFVEIFTYMHYENKN